jgi:hypothetical protein
LLLLAVVHHPKFVDLYSMDLSPRAESTIELMLGEHPDTQYRRSKPPGVEIPTDEAPEHPVLVELHNRAETLDVSSSSLWRSLQLIRTLIKEAEHRGYHVSLTDTDSTEISFALNHFQTTLSISEEREMVEELPDYDNKKMYGWQRVQPRSASLPTGKLTIALAEGWEFRGRRRRWADRTRWSLEDKLGEIMAELDARAAIVNNREAAAERARTERRVQWEMATATAKERYLEDFRRQALLGQVNAFKQAKAIVEYCDALDALAETEPDSDRVAEIRSWTAWARSRAADLDPLSHHPSMPQDPEPGPEDLRPYLDGWSPHGPEERH